MKFPIRKGSTIACGDRRYLECSKLSKSKRHGWTGVGYDFAKNESFRVWSSQWYPIGTILVTECAIDVDLFCIDTERTVVVLLFFLLRTHPSKSKTSSPYDELLLFDT